MVSLVNCWWFCQTFLLYSSQVYAFLKQFAITLLSLYILIDTDESSSGGNHLSNITQKGWIHNQYRLMHKLFSIWQKDVKLVCTYVQVVDYFMMYYHLYYNLIYLITWSKANTNNYVKNSCIETLL